jgi:hypothetical protein
MAIAPRHTPRTLHGGHRDRDTARARYAMAISEDERNAINQLER